MPWAPILIRPAPIPVEIVPDGPATRVAPKIQIYIR